MKLVQKLGLVKLLRRIEVIEDVLYDAGLMQRPKPPVPAPEAPLMPCKILVQPFRGSPNHPLSVYFTFDCPHCNGNCKQTVYVPGRGVVKVVCDCGEFVRVDLQWERV